MDAQSSQTDPASKYPASASVSSQVRHHSPAACACRTEPTSPAASSWNQRAGVSPTTFAGGNSVPPPPASGTSQPGVSRVAAYRA